MKKVIQRKKRRRLDKLQQLLFFRHKVKKKRTVKKRQYKVILLSVAQKLQRSKVFKVIFLFCLLSSLLITLRYFLFSPKFQIKTIIIEGNNKLSTEVIEQRLSYLPGQNIFLVRATKLEHDMSDFSSLVKDVHVEKELPDSIKVIVEERIPTFIWVNFKGIYLIDSEGVVLDTLSEFDGFDLSDDDLDLLRGYGDISSLKNESQSSDEKTEESSSQENEKDVLTLLSDRQKEVISKVDTFWQQNVQSEVYKEYPIIYSYDKGSFHELEEIDSQIVQSTTSILTIDFFQGEVVKYLWESNFRLVVTLTRGRKIIFSTKRNFNEQIEDLEVILTEFQKNNKKFKIIDLSSKVVMYEFEE
jgi:cell division septal protein FtsQ